MSLPINLHHLERKTLSLKGELTASEMQWDTRDDLIRVSQPLHYQLEIQRLDKGILVQGSVRQVLDCECGRCLKAFSHEVKLEPWSCLLELEGEDSVPVNNDCVDLTPYLREDIFLAFPQHPLCGPQCDGLAKPQKDVTSGGAGGPGTVSSVWAELDKLKLE